MLERPETPFEQTETVDGVKVTVSAAAGVIAPDARMNISGGGSGAFTGAAETVLGVEAGDSVIVRHAVFGFTGAEMKGEARVRMRGLGLNSLRDAYPDGEVSVYVLRYIGESSRAEETARRVSADADIGGDSVLFMLPEPGMYDVVTVVRLPEKAAEPAGEEQGEPAEEEQGEPVEEEQGEPVGEEQGEPAGEEQGESAGEEQGEPESEEQGEPAGEEQGEPASEEQGETVSEEQGEPAGEEQDENADEAQGETNEEGAVFTASGTSSAGNVTVTAAAGVFPEGAVLVVSDPAPARMLRAAAGPQEEIADAPAETVVASYAYEITVTDAEGSPIQPAEGMTATVAYALAEAGDPNLSVRVLHETAGGQEELPAHTAEGAVIAETTGFSRYSVEFYYNSKEYVLTGDSSIALSEILAAVDLTGEVTDAAVSDESLFSVSNETGEWIFTAHHTFDTTEWMTVTIGGIDYQITVTDERLASVAYISRDWVNGQVVDTEYMTDDNWSVWPVDAGTNIQAGNYVVNQDITVGDRVLLAGSTSLILMDGYTLTVDGLFIPGGCTLAIYGQSGGTGKLKSDPSSGAAIGGYDGHDNGNIVIHGGTVEANGGSECAGIGGNSNQKSGSITIYGGTVNAAGSKNGAGIGSGAEGTHGGITIYGGTVTTWSRDGAGIGGGENGQAGDITISGGKVTANSSKGAVGIGQGTGATASVTTTLTYTDDTKQDIEITASSYSGTVTFDKKFRSLDGTLRVHGIFQDLGVFSGQTMVAEDGTYRVVIAAAEHGAVTADQERYHVNDEVRLEIVPDTDYILSSLNVDEQDVTGEVDSEGVYTFIMTEYDVTVTATFTQAFCTVTFDTDGGSLVAAQTVNYGEKAVKPDDPTRDGYTFGGWQLEGADYDFDTPVTADITLVAVWEEAPKVTIKGLSGSFNDRIKLNYYFSIPDAVLADEDAYVTLTNESTGKTTTLLIKDASRDAQKVYKFSIPLAAKEASDTITAKVFDGRGDPLTILGSSGKDYTQTGVTHTLMDYFTWLENSGTADEKKVGAAAKDYCAAAQIYFNYNAIGLSVSDAVDAVTADTLSAYAAGREGTLPAGVSIRGITAMLESDNTLRIYFSLKNVDAESFAFKIDGEGAALKQRSDGMCFLAMDAGVWSNRLQDVHSYSVSDGANTYTVTASVLTFARSYVVNGNEKESDLGKALYLYNKAAVEAFGN